MENLFFFWGQEDFLINSEIEKLKNKNIDKNFEVMSYKRIYEPCFEDLLNAIQALPMMFGSIMHVIDVNKFFMSDSENSLDELAMKQLETAFANKSEKNIVVLRLIIPKDSKRKVDTRKKIYKITAKYAQEKQFPIFRHYDKELPKIIEKLGKDNSLKLSSQVISTIIAQAGTSLGIINSELQKLALTIYPSTEPKISDIQNICTQKDDVFFILEAVFKRDFDKAIFELKKVLERITIAEVMAAIQASLRNFVIIKANYSKWGKSGLSRKLNRHEFIIEQNYNIMNEISGTELLKLKHNLIKTDYAIKTGECANPETALEIALMGVSDV